MWPPLEEAIHIGREKGGVVQALQDFEPIDDSGERTLDEKMVNSLR
jgi:hypothetical protein